MATVGPTTVPAFFNTDADFRTWGSTISAALSTLGLVQTADTGQINWTTVSKPASSSLSSGYEIWRFADSLQSGTPIYLKLEYGSGAAADRPSMWIQVGSGSSGAGALTGQVGSRTQAAAGGSKSAGVSLPFYASGNSGELMLAVNVDTASSSFGMLIVVERTKDNTDATTSDGVLVTSISSAAGTAASQFIPVSGGLPGQNTGNWCCAHPNFWSRSASGANADVCPVLIPIAGVWRYSHLMVAKTGDFPSGGTLSCTVFGASHTYMSFDTGFNLGGVVNGISPGVSIRWE